MQRRTFLHLSTAALAALGLSACGAKSASSSTAQEPSYEMDTDIIDASDEFEDIGLTLEEATSSSQHLFFHRSNGKFYPLFEPTYHGTSSSPNYPSYQDISTALMVDNISYQDSYPYGGKDGNPLTDNISLLDGDELVYISSDSVPNSLDFMRTTQSFYTLPIIFKCGNPYREFCTADEILSISALPSREFFDYDSSYIPADDHSTDHLYVHSLSNLTINGLSVQDYCLSHSMIPIYYTKYERDSDHVVDTYNYRYIVNLTPVTYFDQEKALNGIIDLTESNGENTVTISYYEGTQCHVLTLKATCVATIYAPSQSYSCPLSLTPNGYAVVDTSTLPSGSYAISFPPSSQKSSLTTAYNFIDIPFTE